MKEVTRAIIVDDEGKVLLGKRARGTAAKKYALIGGKPEDGETSKDTIVREVKEEIGLTFDPAFSFEEIDSKSDPNEPWRYKGGDSLAKVAKVVTAGA